MARHFDIEAAWHMYSMGATTEEVGNLFGYSKAMVGVYFREAGYVLRGPSERLKGRTKEDLDTEAAWKDYTSGMKLGELSVKYRIPEETLRRRLRVAGYTLRPRGHVPGEHLPSGGRTVDDDGYVLLYRPDHPRHNSNGYVREHRLVMEETIGRYLEPWEEVHHDNLNRSDNTPSNLVLYDSHAEHFRLHMEGNQYWKLRDQKKGHSLQPFDEEGAWQAFRSFVPWTEIARQFGTTYQTIQKRFVLRGWLQKDGPHWIILRDDATPAESDNHDRQLLETNDHQTA